MIGQGSRRLTGAHVEELAMDGSENKPSARIHEHVEDALKKRVTCDAHTKVRLATLGAVDRKIGRDVIAPVHEQAMDEAGPRRE